MAPAAGVLFAGTSSVLVRLYFYFPSLPPCRHTDTHIEARHLSTLHLSTLYNTLINAGNNRYQGRGRRGRDGCIRWPTLAQLVHFVTNVALMRLLRNMYTHTYITERTLPFLFPFSFRGIVKNLNIFKNENFEFK